MNSNKCCKAFSLNQWNNDKTHNMLYAHSYCWVKKMDLILACFLENRQFFSRKLVFFYVYVFWGIWSGCPASSASIYVVIINIENWLLCVKTSIDFIRKPPRKKYSNWEKKLERYFSIFNFHGGLNSFKSVSQETYN